MRTYFMWTLDWIPYAILCNFRDNAFASGIDQVAFTIKAAFYWLNFISEKCLFFSSFIAYLPSFILSISPVSFVWWRQRQALHAPNIVDMNSFWAFSCVPACQTIGYKLRFIAWKSIAFVIVRPSSHFLGFLSSTKLSPLQDWSGSHMDGPTSIRPITNTCNVNVLIRCLVLSCLVYQSASLISMLHM